MYGVHFRERDTVETKNSIPQVLQVLVLDFKGDVILLPIHLLIHMKTGRHLAEAERLVPLEQW